MKRTAARSITSLTLTLGLAAVTAAAAQKPAHARPMAHAPGATPVASPRPDHAKAVDSFRGIAKQLGTTPDALESGYQAARQANPKLTHGQFVAAQVLAHNLGAKYPNVTTQAILDGLKSGKRIGQTLQSLGLGADEAKQAEVDAAREAKQAEHETGSQ